MNKNSTIKDLNKLIINFLDSPKTLNEIISFTNQTQKEIEKSLQYLILEETITEQNGKFSLIKTT